MADGSGKPEEMGQDYHGFKKMQRGERVKKAFWIQDSVNFPKTPNFMREATH